MPQITEIKPDAVLATDTIAFPLADHDAGATVTDHVRPIGGRVNFTDTNLESVPIDIVTYYGQDSRHSFRYGVYVDTPNVTLFPNGPAADWSGVATLEFDYQPHTTQLTGKASNFTLPGDPLDCLVAFAAYFMENRLARLEKRKPDPVLVAEYASAEELYLDQVTGRRKAQVGPGREVW